MSKKTLLISIIASLFLGLSFFSFAKSSESASAMVNNTINDWIKKNDIPGVAVQIYKQGVPKSYYFGVEDRKTKVPVSGDTVFEVGSWTKVMTSLLLAEEVNAGNMKLSDPITQYVPYLTKNPESPFKSVTLLNLATHTGGLPFTVPEEVNTPLKVLYYFDHWKPSAPIGTQWNYSNISIGLLGKALQAEAHRKMDRLYIQQLLKPMDMNLIGLEVPKSFQGHYAQGYDAQGKPVDHYTADLFPAAAGIKMSAHDAGLFLKATLRLPGTPPKIAEAMKTAQTNYVSVEGHGQGLGWVIYPISDPMSEKMRNSLLHPEENMNMGPLPAKILPVNEQRFDGNALIDKTGATTGFRAYIVLIPNQQSGVAILTNRYVSNGEIVKIGREILLNLN